MVVEPKEIVQAFLQVANLAHVSVVEAQVRYELLRAPHKRPTSLPPGLQAVYAFLVGDRCLKVGKAGPKTQARFTSQHYGHERRRAPSPSPSSPIGTSSRRCSRLTGAVRSTP